MEVDLLIETLARLSAASLVLARAERWLAVPDAGFIYPRPPSAAQTRSDPPEQKCPESDRLAAAQVGRLVFLLEHCLIWILLQAKGWG
jgi:hypothetical protein